MELFYYPLSRYSQKVLMAFYEKQQVFTPKVMDLRDPTIRSDFLRIFPLGRLPVLNAGNEQIFPEASIIIEYLDMHFATGTQLLPTKPKQRINVCLFDRLVDTELNDRLYNLDNINDHVSPLPNHLQKKRQENQISTILAKLDQQLSANHWLCGDNFTLADCALVPCLFHPWVTEQLKFYEHLHRYKHQSTLRGAWRLVQDEINLYQIEKYIRLNQIP